MKFIKRGNNTLYVRNVSTSLAATFCTHGNLTVCDLGRSYKRPLQQSEWLVMRAWISVNNESQDKLLILLVLRR